MSVVHPILSSHRHSAKLITFALVLLAACAGVGHAQEQEQAISPQSTTAAPYALFQYATLTGSGNTVYATLIPVVTPSGTIYKNLTLVFKVDSSGKLTVATGYPQVVTAPTPIVSSFQAGKYIGPSTINYGQMIITVSGPGLTDGGATEWTLAAAPGANGCTFPESAGWYVGPLTSNPLYQRLQAAGITSTAWSYGTASSECEGSNNNAAWYPNSLIGISQVGNSLTIASFTDSNKKDHNQPVDQVTYTLSQ